ncbi:Hypothetical Protein FCC1311_085422 [Hondaea fermentalgiana]|uniref:Uncharacterized protein n=1 Tax=Hondaea fermentalgiana TaxID=2315210 RepID=A0A2R5GN42_9STRA|nr:Hypothetical Protein FCC1311_085422 [Hondaea fermentalgiana]|eukprot:GBG32317.1 Hypothetical Protein FCC1311_085422 [Hondaea fermentalgiana]
MVPPPFPFPRRWGEVAAQEGHLWGQTWAVPSPALVALAGGCRSNAGGQNATATQDHEEYEEQQWQPGQEARGCEENEWDLGQGEGNDEILYKRYGLERGKRIAVNEMALDAVFAARATKHGHDGTS